jgi:hypothetical protein
MLRVEGVGGRASRGVGGRGARATRDGASLACGRAPCIETEASGERGGMRRGTRDGRHHTVTNRRVACAVRRERLFDAREGR